MVLLRTPCTVLSFWGVIKQLSLSLRVMWSTFHFIYRLVMFTTLSAVRTVMLLYQLGFWLFQRVRVPYFIILVANYFVGDRKYDNDVPFRKFKRQLFHASISAILEPLRAAMERPVVRRCPDGHYRRVIFDLAAYIADYPEQVLLAGVVQNWCAKYVLIQSLSYSLIIIFTVGVLLFPTTLMVQVVAELENSQKNLWIHGTHKSSGMSMGLTTMY